MVRQVEHKTHPARRMRYSTYLAPMEDVRAICMRILRVSGQLMHFAGVLIVHNWLTGVTTACCCDLRKEEHAAAKVKRRIRIVKIDEILRNVLPVVSFSTRRSVES